MRYRVIAIDLDDVLIHESDPFIRVCRGARRCLEALKAFGVPIVLVTHNTQYQRVIDHLDWRGYFDKVFDDAQDYSFKKTELQRVCQWYGIQPQELVFFDDCPENLQSAKDLGAHAIPVDMDSGITLDDLQLLYEE